MTINEAIQNLEHQLGPINSETIATLAIYFAVPSMHQLITPAINTLMATNPDIKVRPDDLLNMIRQILTASPSFDHSNEIARINAASKFGRKEPFSPTNQRSPNTHCPGNPRTASSSRQFDTRTPSSCFPCHYCGEAGHWSPNCLIKAKANEIKSRAVHRPVNVAGMGVVPSLENNEALLDLGATHPVVGNISLFTSLKPTDMTLSVASSESFKVNAIGTIVLHTSYGTMRINNVLYCNNIPGVILSIGHLLNEGFSIYFLNDSFTISTLTINVRTTKKHNKWFIPFKSTINESIFSKPVNSTMSLITSPDLHTIDHSLLWHRRLSHLSIRHLSRMQKFKAVDGIPNLSFQDIKLCHDCSISKSQHCPVKSRSRNMVNIPGDLIVAYLMGPYPSSLNHKKYILMIQDAFSRVVVAIALANKTEAKTYLINSIKQFMNVTGHRIKTVRTDNGTEFKNQLLNDFLVHYGIIHEYLMPYEHHQNGRIERTNWTISEMARTSLLAARLPSFLWPWAFCHSVWIFNRYLHADDTKTPFELLGKKCPSLDMLRVFGTKLFIYNHNFKKNFMPRATVGFHLGVSEDSKGWLFWVPGKNTIIKSASVSFDESTLYDGMVNASDVHSIQVKNIFNGSMCHRGSYGSKRAWHSGNKNSLGGLQKMIRNTMEYIS
ncbi:hypothetical protein O181_088330 [Austropuccinia psidii MF-1]|uniref:Uncharacterized protein n=1 Tax=Austropuccinia psidii MF-1 TaxID=1389203 RepID=A0A9Q3P3R8_9BASI|nr:hypothetical protein [Austropuccinia psidii MF-1]